MADAIRSSHFLSHYTAPKPCFVFPLLSSQNSSHTKRITKKKHPLQFTRLCTHNFDVISTHEDSDGSFVFRFGNPSEVVKNNELEEANVEVDVKGSDDQDAFIAFNITDSDHLRELMVKTIEGEEKSEDSVEATNPVVGSKSRRVSEIECSSAETSSSCASLDICDSIEITELVDDVIHTTGSIELFDQNVVFGGEGLVAIDGYESRASPTPCPPDLSSILKNQEASSEIAGSLSNKNKELISPELNHVGEVTSDNDHVKEPLIDNDGYQREASISLSVFEHGFGLKDHESAAEITELLTGINQELLPDKLDPVIEVPVDDDGKKIRPQNIEVAHVSNNVDATNEEAGTRNNSIGDGNNSEIIEMVSLSSPSETEPSLHKEINAKNVETDTQNDIMAGIRENEVIGTVPLSLPLVAETVLGEEGDSKSDEIKTQDDVKVGSCESEVIGALPVSLPFGAEPLPYEGGGATPGEVGSHNDTTLSSGESEAIGTMPFSLPSEAEPVLDEGGVKFVEAGTRNDIMMVSSETEVIGKLPMAPPLEVKPIRPNEADIGRTEILDESFRSGTVIMTNTYSEIMEVEVNKETAGIDEPVDSSNSDEPIITDLQSEQIVLEKLFLSSGTASFPHPEKALAGGEDAYFTCQNWLGVADGVSQWSLQGVDHGKYAHEVMEIARELVSSCCNTPVTCPEEVLSLAVDRAHYTGSSTVLISHFDGQDLHVANIGDSGIIILRNDAVCQRSSPMYHEYNFPVLMQEEDDSKLVEQYTFNLEEGDVVVAATDGLFDNLYEEDIISIVSKSLEANISPKEIAEILAMSAQEVGASTCTRSPFSDEAQAAGYTGCTGGKLDDVVVVVSLVKKRLDLQPS